LAYFKTLIVDSSLQGKGWGPRLTQLSIKSLRKTGATSIICHCWKESPKNSSFKYLTKLGFTPVGEIKNFWQDIDYECVVCKPHKCTCTAIEMIKKLEKDKK
jgi:ribosomal protein S18 acetylase RimI-like enzyme